MYVGSHRFKSINVLLFIGKYIYNTEDGSVNYKVICAKHIDKLLKNFLTIFSIIMLSYNGIMFGPIYAYFYQNVRTTPLGVHLPFFEKNSDTEYITSMTLQGGLAVYAILGTFLNEMLTCTVVGTVAIIPDLIRFNLKESCKEYKINGMNLKSTVQVRNALVLIQDFNA